MAIPVSLILCLGIAVLTIGLTVQHLIVLYRRPEPGTMADAAKLVHKIVAAFQRLGDLESKEREALCREIARDIRDSSEILIWLIDGENWATAARDKKTRDKAKLKLSMDARCLALRVYWQARWILFLFRFRPSLVRDCSRLAETALLHSHTWMAYFRFLRAQYPEILGHLTIPE